MKSIGKALVAISFFFIFFVIPKNIKAIENPLNVPNNPYGIHIVDESDLDDAARLVNSSGGDWGYVTLVIRKDERDTNRWQGVFNKMRRLHLIPIVRIATRQQNGGWEKPSFDEIDGWVSFLDSLNWVVLNRYVIIGNEPNHAKEWGGEINPEEYARYLYDISKKLKQASPDFFILPAGFDASAPTNKTSVSESDFIKNMLEAKPNVFEHIDGWASHSYPNPDFSGSEIDSGRGSIKNYEWELNFLKSNGLEKDFPVFITETGWAHNTEGAKNGYKSENAISESLISAFNTAWKDTRIVAVTPFILNYQHPPFDIFSWKKKDGGFYKFYDRVKDLPKIYGSPVQKISGFIITVIFPPIFPTNNKLTGLALAQNTGQSIWDGNEKILVNGNLMNYELQPIRILSDIEPSQTTLALFRIEL